MSNREIFTAFIRWLFLGEQLEKPKPIPIKADRPERDDRTRRNVGEYRR